MSAFALSIRSAARFGAPEGASHAAGSTPRIHVPCSLQWSHSAWLDDLQDAGAERRQIGGKQAPCVKFVLQPANSPDTNVNDLCFFRSLVRHVQAHEREFRHDPRGLEEFWAFLQRDFYDFHSRETLERCWDVKTAVNACILEASGKNNYKIPHGFNDVQTISAPIACDSVISLESRRQAREIVPRSRCLLIFCR